MAQITCPKCNYQRKPSDTAPDYECPQCGVIYSKAKARRENGPSSRLDAQQTRPHEADSRYSDSTLIDARAPKVRWINSRQNRLLLASVAASLVVGYFAGREHVKYELRSAFEDAAQGIRRLFTGDTPPKVDAPKPAAQREQPIVPSLVRKGFREGEYGRNAITFTVRFSNRTGKDIRAFDGNLVFTDLLGNEIHSAKLAINEPVTNGATYSWDGELSYNQFMSAHERLKGAEVENMKTLLVTKKVLFSDGEIKEYDR
ncbi:MAG: hypothetical protein AW09_000201 [Candidatus Accumulibacter phosphatis]|uniref:Uncharacterized protein n=1 Tax=Candidatus Accumulibacter phosphatis TaxID=327160 RepID=A0A080M2D7_9PROT|nr:MAG: hypothetical protein AW09_000201 [Candidatus Accumulibacter phosphatis]